MFETDLARYSPNFTRSFPTSINFADSTPNLLCSYFSSVFISTTTTPSVQIASNRAPFISVAVVCLSS